jgi:tetratricopeptide (TPR) repeat protein
MHRFSVKYVESVLGIPRSIIAAFIRAGFVTPVRGVRREYCFSFQDIVVLRTGERLISSKIAPRKIVQALRRLRQRLPAEFPLTGLRIAAIGKDIAVRQGPHWQSHSGQYLFDFETTAVGDTVRFPNKPPSGSPARIAGISLAEDWFVTGCMSEDRDRRQAQAAYQKCIENDAEHCDAYLNLGHMLQEEGLHGEACALYRKAIYHCLPNPQLHYNLGVALEDTQQAEAALVAYANCIALDPAFADAHYNAARLHEALGHAQQAIRHYSEYRRLQGRR